MGAFPSVFLLFGSDGVWSQHLLNEATKILLVLVADVDG
jgi:hypothetical protein